MKKKIALIQGGLGAEKEVSRTTGQCFAKALDKLDYHYEVIEAGADLPSLLSKSKPDVALLALHGKYAEDGTVQGICEYLKIPYSGSGVLGSALCFNKAATYQMLSSKGLPLPKFEVIDSGTVKLEKVKTKLSFPLVVKPAREGSSVGITIVKDQSGLLSALKLADQSDHLILVDEYIPGMELTVSVVNGKAYTPIEIVPKTGYYNYENKYTAGNTDYFLPPRLDSAVVEQCKSVAEKAVDACYLRSFGRVDFRVKDNLEPKIIEINTLPGCTPTSLFPKSMAYDGIGFEKVIEMFINTAGLDYEGVV